MTERRTYRITGTVQGVGYRWWTRNTANANNLRGTVRNAEDGSVEVTVQGPSPALDAFEEKLHDGPPTASVRSVSRGHPGDDPLPEEFEIRR